MEFMDVIMGIMMVALVCFGVALSAYGCVSLFIEIKRIWKKGF